MSKDSDDKIVAQAKKRFERCESYESKARENYLYDTKFAAGDSSNMYQWPEAISRSRSSNDRVCLTINKTMQHCRQIINDSRQNESQIEIRPVGNGATYEAAQIFEGVVRHIEYQSNAQAAYSNANFHQVIGGIGYWRVTTDYSHDDSFDQEIYIKRVADPLSIYLDPDIGEFDGSDARFGLVFRDMSRDEYEESYGDMDDVEGNVSPLGTGSNDGDAWDSEDHVRVCEYYRRLDGTDKLHELDNGMTVRESDVIEKEKTHPGIRDQLGINSVRSREISSPQIEWFLIAGSKIIDKKKWPGKYIPIVRCVGEEIVIDKVMDRSGHVRQLIDAQRQYNFWSSAAVEQVALIGKTPYISPIEAIEGFEEEWRDANLENKAILAYNAFSEDGREIPKPERQAPPQMAPAYLSGLQIAKDEMMMVSGQYEATFGAKSNETSGRAVQERRRNGDNATYHFIDHFSQAIQYTGRILVDLIPKIYDTARVLKILGQDGTQTTVQLDPSNQNAHQQVQDPDDDENYDPQQVASIFNPNVGVYEVEADIGPSFSTRRQETFQALSQMMTQNKELAAIAGDIMFKAADFPLADEVAKRLRAMVPKQALGKDQPDPQVVQLQQQMAQQHQAMMEITNKLQQAQNKASQHDPNLEWYNAETQRLAVVGKIDAAALMPIVRELVSQVLGQPANPIIAMHQQENSMMPGSDQNQSAQEHAQNMAQQQAAQDHQVNMQQSTQDHQAGMQIMNQKAQEDQANLEAANQKASEPQGT